MKSLKLSASRRSIITDLELLEALSPFNQTTRTALMFALSTNLTPEEIIFLNWDDLENIHLNVDAVTLLNSLPRHIFSKLIFWEMIDNEPIPLFDLDDAINKLTGGLSLDKYREIYKEGVVYIEKSSLRFIREVNKNIFDRT